MKKRQGSTAKDVATACQVSQATVSYVVNNTAGKHISEAKRQEILETARQMNYFPNVSAKSMRQQDCMSIGLISGNNYSNSGFAETLFGIKLYLDLVGYTVTLLSDAKGEEQQEIIRYYHSNIIGGVIFISFDSQIIDLETIEEHHIPYVVISENGVQCQSMEPKRAFELVIRDCIQFCKDNELRRIRYFTRQVKDKLYHNKYDLIRKAVDDLFPMCDFERIVCMTQRDEDEEITAPITEYLENHDFDIAFSPNQRFGLLMQNCILKNRFQVPQAVKHICLASSPFLQTIYPQVSSLHIPLMEMGNYAARLIVSLIEEAPISTRDFECRLVHGDSTRL